MENWVFAFCFSLHCKYILFQITDCTNGLLIGNGFCNDETNHEACLYDGGDCCGSCIVTKHCLECACLDQKNIELDTANPLVGDGYCHDETNNEVCNFDGGDCCGPCINTEFCSECFCHLGNLSK